MAPKADQYPINNQCEPIDGYYGNLETILSHYSILDGNDDEWDKDHQKCNTKNPTNIDAVSTWTIESEWYKPKRKAHEKVAQLLKCDKHSMGVVLNKKRYAFGFIIYQAGRNNRDLNEISTDQYYPWNDGKNQRDVAK